MGGCPLYNTATAILSTPYSEQRKVRCFRVAYLTRRKKRASALPTEVRWIFDLPAVVSQVGSWHGMARVVFDNVNNAMRGLGQYMEWMRYFDYYRSISQTHTSSFTYLVIKPYTGAYH